MALTVTEIDDAIRRVINGAQSVTLRNGTSYSHANLAELQKLRDTVLVEESQSERGSIFVPLGFGRPQ